MFTGLFLFLFLAPSPVTSLEDEAPPAPIPQCYFTGSKSVTVTYGDDYLVEPIDVQTRYIYCEEEGHVREVITTTEWKRDKTTLTIKINKPLFLGAHCPPDITSVTTSEVTDSEVEIEYPDGQCPEDTCPEGDCDESECCYKYSDSWSYEYRNYEYSYNEWYEKVPCDEGHVMALITEELHTWERREWYEENWWNRCTDESDVDCDAKDRSWQTPWVRVTEDSKRTVLMDCPPTFHSLATGAGEEHGTAGLLRAVEESVWPGLDALFALRS